MQWFCRVIKACIISVKIYAAVMVKVTIEIKVIVSLNKIKKAILAARVTFFAMPVISTERPDSHLLIKKS